MLYLANPSSGPVNDAMSAGFIGCMTTRSQGNKIPPGAHYLADNEKFGKAWPGPEKWFSWLAKTVAEYGADRCIAAVAPDVPFNAAGTYHESLPHLEKIRSLDVPPAFAAQAFSEEPGMIPWDDLALSGPSGRPSVIFIAGGKVCRTCRYDGLGWKETPRSRKAYCPWCQERIHEWKLSPQAAEVVREAKSRGLRAHMGRVNSETRMRHAMAIGCDTTDGTFLTFGRTTNLARLLQWRAQIPKRQPPHIEFPLFDISYQEAS